MTISPVINNIVHRIQPIDPIQRTLTATEKPKEPLFANIKDEIILQTPKQKAEELVGLSYRTSSRKQKEKWLITAGIETLSIQGVGPLVPFNEAYPREISQEYIRQLNIQKEIAGYRV